MAEYVAGSFSKVEDLPRICRHALRTIGEIDETIKRVCAVADSQPDTFSAKKRRTTKLSEKDSCSLLVQDLCDRRINISMKLYDLIDKHTKECDRQLSTMADILHLRGVHVAPPTEKDESNLSNEPLYCICKQVFHVRSPSFFISYERIFVDRWPLVI